jgi:hypothetical protein
MQDRQRENKRQWSRDRENQQNLALHIDLPNCPAPAEKLAYSFLLTIDASKLANRFKARA